MSNITIKHNLLKLKKAFVHNIVGKNSTVKCICIPIELNNLYSSDKGVYLESQAFELKERKADVKDTHIIKQSIPKALFSNMSQADKDAYPIIGNAIVWNNAPATSPAITPPAGTTATSGGYSQGNMPDEDDLPF